MTDEQRAKKAEASRRYREKNRDKVREAQQASRSTLSGREKARKAARQSMARRRSERPATYWFYNLKKRAQDSNKEFDLTEEFLGELLAPMVCSVTGISLSHTGDCEPDAHGRMSPWAPSVDRINSARGYTQDNVRLTCWAFNMAKGPWHESVFARVAQAYVRKNDGQCQSTTV